MRTVDQLRSGAVCAVLRCPLVTCWHSAVEIRCAINASRFPKPYGAWRRSYDHTSPPNNPIKLSVRVVTPRATARVAPTRPATYRVRWPEKNMQTLLRTSAFLPPLLLTTITLAQQPPPEVCDLAVRAELKRGDVFVTWKGGTPPFMVVRSNEAMLSDKSDVRIIESNLDTRILIIPEHPGLRYPYWYQVFDSNAVPEAFSVKPAIFAKGQTITLRGVGFSENCALNQVTVGGIAAEDVRGCSRNGLKFRAPVNSEASHIGIQGPRGNGGVGDQQRCNGAIRHPQSW